MAAELERIDLDIEIGTMYVTGFEVEDLRRILDHLPNQQESVFDGHRGEDITPHGIGQVSEWLRDNWNSHDIEDCAACVTVAEGGDQELCPPHHGYAIAYQRAWGQAVSNNKPDQQDDWQECAFEEIRKGDRVKKVLVTESGQIHTTEGVANYYLVAGDLRWWFTEKASWKDSGVDQYIARSDEPHGGPVQVTLYRIPAPVQHPDPEQHPVILVKSTKNREHNPPEPAVAKSQGYYSTINSGLYTPKHITDWEPAKIVPAGDA